METTEVVPGGTNHGYKLSWKDEASQTCISGYTIETDYLAEEKIKRSSRTLATAARSDETINVQLAAYIFAIRVNGNAGDSNRSRNSKWTVISYNHPEPDEEEEEEPPWPPTVEYSNHTTNANNWTCLGFAGCFANYAVTFTDPQDSGQTTSDTTFGYQFRNLTYPTNSDGLDDENGFIRHYVSNLTRQARHRPDGGD